MKIIIFLLIVFVSLGIVNAVTIDNTTISVNDNVLNLGDSVLIQAKLNISGQANTNATIQLFQPNGSYYSYYQCPSPYNNLSCNATYNHSNPSLVYSIQGTLESDFGTSVNGWVPLWNATNCGTEGIDNCGNYSLSNLYGSNYLMYAQSQSSGIKTYHFKMKNITTTSSLSFYLGELSFSPLGGEIYIAGEAHLLAGGWNNFTIVVDFTEANPKYISYLNNVNKYNFTGTVVSISNFSLFPLGINEEIDFDDFYTCSGVNLNCGQNASGIVYSGGLSSVENGTWTARYNITGEQNFTGDSKFIVDFDCNPQFDVTFSGITRTCTNFNPVVNVVFNSVNLITNSFSVIAGKFIAWDASSNILVNMSTLSVGTWCYQETANDTVVGDGTCTLSFTGTYECTGTWSGSETCAKVYDGNWLTEGTSTITNVASLFINYTKPTNSNNNSKWMVKDLVGSESITIPQTCWDFNANILALKTFGSHDSSYTRWTCLNTTNGWQIIRTDAVTTYEAFEEAMNWSIT